MMHWQGLTELKGSSYTPIALVNADPAGLQVRDDSPYKTAKDLIDAIKANPGKLKSSGTGQGGIWHLGHRRHAAVARRRSRGVAVGAVERRGARPAGPRRRRRRDRALLAARGTFADRRGQGAQPRHHGCQAGGAVSQRADAEGGDRQRLDHGRVARDRGAQGPAEGHRATSCWRRWRRCTRAPSSTTS